MIGRNISTLYVKRSSSIFELQPRYVQQLSNKDVFIRVTEI